eukprot:snap_masked-scaffold_32-processed-gene-0.11-mRNA-1 protein AED:1.00 eAED:1.00 QI:0/0/0/0/1/1/2/0/354
MNLEVSGEFSLKFFETYKKLDYAKVGSLRSVPYFDRKTVFSSITRLDLVGSFGFLLPDEFMHFFPNIRSVFLDDMDHKECEESFVNRMKMETNYSFYTSSLSDTCIFLDGSVDLTPFENDYCSVAQSYQAREGILDHFLRYNPFLVPWTDKVSEGVFRSRNGTTLFSSVEMIQVTLFKPIVLNWGNFDSETFPILREIQFNAVEIEEISFQDYNVSESVVTDISVVWSTIIGNMFFQQGILKLASLERLRIHTTEIKIIPSLVTSQSPLMYFTLDGTETELIPADSLCPLDGTSPLKEFTLRGSPHAIFEDGVFLNCKNLIAITLDVPLFNETEDDFITRTGACVNENCVLVFV